MGMYRNLQLDPFQQEAMEAIDRGLSVIVSAPTGTGKTLIADYLVEKALNERQSIVYTAPIKALSNQKYKDFTRTFGVETVGIMTGDVVINPTAPLLIMTTEVFRNQVITNDPKLNQVSCVIFDEIHWLNDEDRGTVWEESIILAPSHMRILGLSATIANAQELCDWISGIRRQEVCLIEEYRRVVPLEYRYFTKETGFVTFERLLSFYEKRAQNISAADYADISALFDVTTHIDLIKKIEKDALPCLFFVFSRRLCTDKAVELAALRTYLDPQRQGEVRELFLNLLGEEPAWSPSTRQLYRTCSRGVAYHHAGLLPVQKSLVEDLFLARYISVLYCTETFSVGINYPVRTVCFDTLNKYDGHTFRALKNHEFFQMSGRAGRRGIDVKGFSFAIVDLNYWRKNPPPRFQINHLEPLTSQFRLTYNTALNLLATLSPEQIKTYFQKSFASHAHRMLETQIQDQMSDLRRQLDTIEASTCAKVGTLSCPLEYGPRLKELERLRRSYQRLDYRQRRKSYGRHLLRKIRSSEKILPAVRESCDKAPQALCHGHSRDRLRLLAVRADLEKQLAALPSSHMFYNQFLYKLTHLEQLGYIEREYRASADSIGSADPSAFTDSINSSNPRPLPHPALPLNPAGCLLARGRLARHIYVQELLVTELIFSGLLEELDNPSLSALVSCIDYENRKNDFFARFEIIDFEPVKQIVRFLQSVCGPEAVRFDSRVAVITHAWSTSASLSEVQKLCNLDEGDIVAVFRRTIDLLRQMREAVGASDLRERFSACMRALDRDEAAIMDT